MVTSAGAYQYRSEPVPATEGVVEHSLLPSGSHGRPCGGPPLPRDPSRPDRPWRHVARVGLLSYTTPVDAGPMGSPRPTASRRCGEPIAAHHAPAARVGGTAHGRPHRSCRSGRDARSDRRSQDRPARHQAAGRREHLPAVRRGDVHQAAWPARPGSRHVPVRPRPRGDVPADPDGVAGSRTARRCWG